jgi:radical SAM superfamily enzyme YgiQ (UPF0313 family)
MEADGVDIDNLIEIIGKEKPDEVGIICSGSNPSASTMTMPGAIKIVKSIKKVFPNQRTFMWGGHPTVLPERTKYESGVDYVVVGTGFDCDVRDIPMIDWDKINPNKYKAHNWHCFGDLENRTPYAAVWTSLGCPYSCEYCCVNNLFQKRTYMTRDVHSVINEIDYLVNKHGVKNIKIMDELFVTKNQRVLEFCDLLIERNYNLNMWCFARMDTVTPQLLAKLKKAGVNWVAYGFETINQHILDSQKKGVDVNEYSKVIKWTKNAGINIIADFIAGFYEDTYETLNDTYDFMCSHNFEFINLYPLFAYPGTPLYDTYFKEELITHKDWNEYSLYGYDCIPCRTRYLSSSEVLEWRDTKYVEYFKRPEYRNMILNKFGAGTLIHVDGMARQHLDRKIYSIQANEVLT